MMLRKVLPFVAAAVLAAAVCAVASAADYGVHVRNEASVAVDVAVYRTDPATRVGAPPQYCIQPKRSGVGFLAKGSNTVEFRFHTHGCKGAVVSSQHFVVTGMTEFFTVTGSNGHYNVTHVAGDH